MEMALLAFLQLVVGVALFAAAGYFSAKAILGSERELVEVVAYSILFGLLIPPMLLLAANLVAGIKINDLLVVYGAYALVALAGFFASLKRSNSPASSRVV